MGLIGATFIGPDELGAAFGELSQGIRNRVLKHAVNKAARILVSPLRRATPVADQLFGRQASRNPPGTMRRAVGVALRKYRGGDVHAAYVGHRWPKGAAAHLIEGGTQDRTTSGGAFRGRVTPHPYFTPLYAQYHGSMWGALVDDIADGLAKERDKAAAKALKAQS